MSATDAAIKKMYGHGTKTVKVSNEDLNDMTKIVKALEDSNVLIKRVTKTLKNDIKKAVLYQCYYQCYWELWEHIY